MKVKQLLKKINRTSNITIEFMEKFSNASYGFYTLNELIYNDRYNNYNIKDIYIQKVGDKINVVIYI